MLCRSPWKCIGSGVGGGFVGIAVVIGYGILVVDVVGAGVVGVGADVVGVEV